RRLGSAHATIRSDDISIVCMGGGGVTPGYWSSDGKGYCFPCSFDFTSGSRSMSIWFAFKVDGPRAAFPFAVDYRGFGPMPLVPSRTLAAHQAPAGAPWPRGPPCGRQRLPRSPRRARRPPTATASHSPQGTYQGSSRPGDL